MSIDLSQFFDTFFDEASDHLAEMERLLLAMDVAAPEAEELDGIFRAAHSIKGGAGIFGFTKLAELTHILESHLDMLRAGRAAMTDAIADALLQAVDYLRALLQCCRDRSEPDAAEFAAMRERFEHIGMADAPVPASATTISGDAGHVKGDDEDASFGLFAAPVPNAVAAQEEGFGLFEPAEAGREDDNEGFGFFAPEPAASASAPTAPPAGVTRIDGARREAKDASAKASPDAASIRVSVERVDQLINLVGELVITQAMLAETGQHMEGAQAERLQRSLALLERNTRDLQEAVLSIRMLPISFVFNRFPRVVRDLAHKLDKQVDLHIHGEGTELDRGLIEKLVDPLTHLVRNSIDHGIEAPAQRQAVGKSPRGAVSLRASQQGGNIVVEVADDGAGLDRQRILAKARENGLQVSDSMSDAEVWQLIFMPGFSTAAQVTDVSGRGVGMDVVKRNISDLGGRVEISSTPGVGSIFTIRLPLTLAILDGMSVAVGKEVFIVPVTFILESLQPRKDDIRSVAGKGRVVHVRGEHVPLIDLPGLLGITATRSATDSILLLVQSGGDKAALPIDDLLGQHQVVIKSLEANYRRVGGVSGATVMGDGRVALILDVADIVRQHALPAAA